MTRQRELQQPFYNPLFPQKHDRHPHLAKSPFVELVSTCEIILSETQACKFNIAHHNPHIDARLAGEPFDPMVTLTDAGTREATQARAAGWETWERTRWKYGGRTRVGQDRSPG